MNFQLFGNDKAPTLLLIPGLGVSYEIFLPLKWRVTGIFSSGQRDYDAHFAICSLPNARDLMGLEDGVFTLNVKTAEPANKPAAAKRQTGVTGQPLHPVEELAKAKAVVRELLQRGANIADAYGDYLKLGFSLASGLGSEGHDLYHQLCSQSPKYNEADCERKWQECISKSDGRTTLATFYSMAKQAGIDLSRISREFKPETIYHF